MPKKVIAYWLLIHVTSGPMVNVRRCVGWYFASTPSDASTPSLWPPTETEPRTDNHAANVESDRPMFGMQEIGADSGWCSTPWNPSDEISVIADAYERKAAGEIVAASGIPRSVDDAGAHLKPFSMEEFVARVRALMRRPPELQSLTPEFGDIQLRPDEGCMTCGPETVTLAPAELQIMVVLIRAGGTTVRRSALEVAAWGLGEAVTPNALDVAMHESVPASTDLDFGDERR